ncbi:hypothetical protein WJX75_000338 [Coccomyxa subellipsoidea]|uniref:Uncharacterized protein n=1 Tax=Coccomyxa subellipsoidea TaxID=248742 RepID=A0ABR2YCL3_9CHLO
MSDQILSPTSSDQGPGLRRVQPIPAGWEGFYTILKTGINRGKPKGYLAYTTVCTCLTKQGKPIRRKVDVPDKIVKFAKEHGNHGPEYNILKPRRDEKYPAGLVVGERLRHPGYIIYQKRMQSLGFYTSVKMLERAGYSLPDHAQKEWDEIRYAADINYEEDESSEDESAEMSNEERSPGSQSSAGRNRAAPAAEGTADSADACAGPRGSTPAAAPTTPAPGQAPHSKIEEVVDLSADSPRASSSNQLPGPFAGLPLAHVPSDEDVPGREAADGAADRKGDPVVKQEKPLPATSAMLPPAFAQPAPNRLTGQLHGACTLSDVIADLTRLKALEPMIAAAGLCIDFDQDLQCLQSAHDRVGLAHHQDSRIDELLTKARAKQKQHKAALAAMEHRADRNERLKDGEIQSSRSEITLMQAEGGLETC